MRSLTRLLGVGLCVLSLTSAAAATAAAATAEAGDNCTTYYAGQRNPPATAQRWCNEGSYFTFSSRWNAGREVRLFYRCAGNKSNPAIVLGHGWPTSSFDFQDLSALLEPHLYVCSLDYAGHGFSDKPANTTDAPYAYHIRDHAQAIYDLVTGELGLTKFAYLTHDEGSSVGFRFLQMLEEGAAAGKQAPFTLTHHFVLDGSIYLPMANITKSQEDLLSNATGPGVQKLVPPAVFAAGLGAKVYTPKLSVGQVAALSSVFAYRDGTRILHETIQYLQDRHEHEVEWLGVLHRSTVNCSLIWGMLDPVAVPAVADYVWDNYLKDRPNAPSSYTQLPDANHYLQVGNAADIAQLVLGAFA